MAHIHAESMAQFAEDAKQMDLPWLNWEFRNSNERDKTWSQLVNMPMWSKDYEYRRKPKLQQIRFLIQDGTNATTEFMIPIPQMPMHIFISDLVAMIKEKYNV